MLLKTPQFDGQVPFLGAVIPVDRAGNVLTGESIAIATKSVTRPADTNVYASGDLLANATVAASVAPIPLAVARVAGGAGYIRRIRLRKTGVSITNASFRVHFYKVSPTVSNGDNGVWLTSESTYLGSADITMDRVFTDGAKGIYVPNQGGEITFDTAEDTQTIFALIEVRGAYVPVSGEVFTLALEVFRF